MTGTPKNVAAAAGGIDDAVPSEILNEGSSWETSTLRRGRFRNDEGGDPDIDEAMERLSRRHAYRFAKRAFDIVFSCLFLALFCWFFVVVAFA